MRKAEVLIAQGKEDESLTLLNSADQSICESRYGEELVLLRGRALHHAGNSDEADIILRELMDRIIDREDVFSQVLLELGRINYEQYRDHDARGFYELVCETQAGKDWFVAGRLGLAECSFLQQRYDESVVHYQEAIDLIKQYPNNRCVDPVDIQESLALQAHHLALIKQYDLALPFLELEQQIASENDVIAADRFARIHF